MRYVEHSYEGLTPQEKYDRALQDCKTRMYGDVYFDPWVKMCRERSTTWPVFKSVVAMSFGIHGYMTEALYEHIFPS